MLSNKTITELIKVFDQAEPHDIHEWVRLLNLPKCDHSVRIAHNVRNRIMSIRQRTGKYDGIAKMDHKTLCEALAVLESHQEELKAAHTTQLIMDALFDTTH